MLKLAERMTNNFCGGVSASTAHTWVTLAGNGGADDVRVLIRKSVDDPGRPPGIVLSAATSLWLPVPPSKVFQFLRDARFRTEVHKQNLPASFACFCFKNPRFDRPNDR
jgi:homeobox-leucine zipper protein